MSIFTLKNRTFKNENSLMIYLNIPEDCIYDITEIIIEYNYKDKTVHVISSDIPKNIKTKMESFYNENLTEFVSFLETNLETFLSGNEPIKIIPSTINEDKIISLPEKYVYPTHTVNVNTLQIHNVKKGIYFFIAKKIQIQVVCKKCKTSLELEDVKTCKCGNLLKCNFIPTLNNEILGSLFLDNCTYLNFNPTNFQFNCDNCFSNYQSYKIGINTKFLMNCWKCNSQLSFCIKKVNFFEKKNQLFKVGTELPNKGTCKHYKKSFRWFRFSCCKSVYPCDICHDNENNHLAEIANKMICGFCSKEQSAKNNCECGMDLKKTTTFWEGGKGSRNKITMSKKDSKKYSK